MFIRFNGTKDGFIKEVILPVREIKRCYIEREEDDPDNNGNLDYVIESDLACYYVSADVYDTFTKKLLEG